MGLKLINNKYSYDKGTKICSLDINVQISKHASDRTLFIEKRPRRVAELVLAGLYPLL